MSVEERRSMIVQAAIPLYLEYGGSVTSRQLAEHIGIAEGTIFRAFQDKDSLVREVVRTFFAQSHEDIVDEVAAQKSLEGKLRMVVRHSRERAQGLFTMISLVDPSEARTIMCQSHKRNFYEDLAQAFVADAIALNVPPQRMADLIRVFVVASASPRLGEGPALSEDEIVSFMLYGLTGKPGAHSADSPAGQPETSSPEKEVEY